MTVRRLLPLILAALPFLASADSAKPLGKSGDWESFTYAEKGGRVCYMASLPKHSSGAPKGRGPAFVTITHRTSDKSVGVVSVTQGVAFKKDSAPQIEIGGSRFDLYVSGDTAWSRNDKAVVAALSKGKAAQIHGQSAKGEAITDSYSLDGFGKAYSEISKACGVP